MVLIGPVGIVILAVLLLRLLTRQPQEDNGLFPLRCWRCGKPTPWQGTVCHQCGADKTRLKERRKQMHREYLWVYVVVAVILFGALAAGFIVGEYREYMSQFEHHRR